VGQHKTWDGGRVDKWVSGHIQSDSAKAALITMGYYQGSPARDGSQSEYMRGSIRSQPPT
jgi:hypothetical protein